MFTTLLTCPSENKATGKIDKKKTGHVKELRVLMF